MRAITLWQPYATAIAKGLKRVETRPAWALQLRGSVGERIAIHAAVRPPRDVPAERVFGEYRLRTVGRTGWALEGPGLPPFRSTPRPEGVRLPLGVILATARIAAVVPIVDDSRARNCVDVRPGHPEAGMALRLDEPVLDDDGVPIPVRAEHRPEQITDLADQVPWGDWTPGRVAIVLDDVRELPEPIECRGYQRMWTVRGLAATRLDLENSLADARQARDKLRTP